MLETSNFESDFASSEWAKRSEYWIAESAKPKRKRRVRERNSNPLILAGHGTSLRVEKGTLLIKQGFTHYPQKAEQFRFFKGDLELPRMIILLDGSGTISFEVLNWLGAQGVALARIKWDGSTAIFASGAGFVANAEKLRWQFELQSNEVKRLEFAKDLLSRKFVNCLATLEAQFESSTKREKATAKAQWAIAELERSRFCEMQDLRGIEGQVAAAYFTVWTEIQMQWKAEGRYPIPDNWCSYRSRSSILTGKKSRNWKASHPINAMANYAYAVRVAQLQIEAVANGYDPYSGIMHHSRPDFPAYAYDLVEPERPKVDAMILEFVQRHTFTGADFVIRTDGVCRLSPQLAGVVSSLVL
ncbi:MAG: CRISPR-associated endonuclease Cas1 [Pontixanthobacter sp.]